MLAFRSAVAAMLLLAAGVARAEISEIRFARQFSIGYIQLNVIDKLGLLEKHGRALGLDLHSKLVTLSGAMAVNDALLSGNVEVVSGGIPSLLVLWSRTRGTPQEVAGVSGLSTQPIFLVTRSPTIRTIKDYTPEDRIAMPSVKLSLPAVLLQMAAAQAWGDSEWARLDPITVALSLADADIGLRSGSANFNSVFSAPPYQYDELKLPGIHTVLSSFDIVGPSTFTMAWTTKTFRDANPKAYRALIAALQEATEIANRDPRLAATAWIEDSRSKLSPDEVAAYFTAPGVSWTMTPQGTMRYAAFMHRVGSLKVKPESWKDYFLPEIHDLPGS